MLRARNIVRSSIGKCFYHAKTINFAQRAMEVETAFDELNPDIVFRNSSGEAISPWHDVPAAVREKNLFTNLVVSTPRRERRRVEMIPYEMNNPLRVLRDEDGMPRAYQSAAPGNLGFVPQTWCPVDIDDVSRDVLDAGVADVEEAVGKEAGLEVWQGLERELSSIGGILGREGGGLGVLELSGETLSAFSVHMLEIGGVLGFLKGDGKTVAWRLLGAVEGKEKGVSTGPSWLRGGEGQGVVDLGSKGETDKLVHARALVAQKWCIGSESSSIAGPEQLDGAVGQHAGASDGSSGLWTPLANGKIFGKGVARAILRAHHRAWKHLVVTERMRPQTQAQLTGYHAIREMAKPHPWVSLQPNWTPPTPINAPEPFTPVQIPPSAAPEAPKSSLTPEQRRKFNKTLADWAAENQRREERPSNAH